MWRGDIQSCGVVVAGGEGYVEGRGGEGREKVIKILFSIERWSWGGEKKKEKENFIDEPKQTFVQTFLEKRKGGSAEAEFAQEFLELDTDRGSASQERPPG